MKKKGVGAARRRKTSTQERLRILQTVMRALRKHGSNGGAVQPQAGPPKFIHCWAVSGRPVTQALDSEGQVWERVWRKATETTPEESWWERIGMERRETTSMQRQGAVQKEKA
jgi:hypothetical protein